MPKRPQNTCCAEAELGNVERWAYSRRNCGAVCLLVQSCLGVDGAIISAQRIFHRDIRLAVVKKIHKEAADLLYLLVHATV